MASSHTWHLIESKRHFNIPVCCTDCFMNSFIISHIMWCKEPLRTVPTFVSCMYTAHTFCASHKPWFKHTCALILTLTKSTMPPTAWLKLKQNFSSLTQSILVNLCLNQWHQNSSWKPSWYLSKFTLKSNCKHEHVPANGIVHAQLCKCLTHWGDDRKKSNGRCKSFQKRSITLKNVWLTLNFMLQNKSGKPIQHVISFWLWAKVISTVF